MNVLRNILLFINVPNFTFAPERQKDYNDISSFFTATEIMKYIRIINEYLFEMKKTNNVRILFEMMTILLMQEEQDTQPFYQEKKENLKMEKEKIEENIQKENTIPFVPNFESNRTEERVQPKISKSQSTTEITENIRTLQHLRINNTLYGFNKQKMIEIKNKLEEAKKLLIDDEYSNYASMILDAEIKVASEDHIVFLCKNERMETEFLQNLPYIDKTLEKVYGKKMIASATKFEDWTIIKNEFNNKLKKYEWIEEPQNIMEYYENQQNTLSMIDNIFADIVEYS